MISCAYLLIAGICLSLQAIDADEFWYAHHIASYLKALPYRDFLPYKTVLGYYLLTPALGTTFSGSTLFLAMRTELLIINAACIVLAGLWLHRYFKPPAILIALVLCVMTHLFLSFGAQIRVGMMAAWMACFALCALLEKRLLLAGLLLGLSFCITQRSIYFIIAANVGLLAYSFPKRPFQSLCKMNGVIGAVVLGYIIIWSSVSDLYTVLNNVFWEGYHQASLNYYLPVRKLLWWHSLLRDPFFFLVWSISTVMCWHLNPKRRLILGFAYSLFVLNLSNTQPFAYALSMLIPVSIVLYACCLDCVWDDIPKHRGLIVLLAIPLLCTTMNITHSLLSYQNRYQFRMINGLEKLVDADHGYIAGSPVLSRVDQTGKAFRNLIGPTISYMETQNANWLPALLPSLLITPSDLHTADKELRNPKLGVILFSERIALLHPSLKKTIISQFKPWCGSVYVRDVERAKTLWPCHEPPTPKGFQKLFPMYYDLGLTLHSDKEVER